MKTPKLLAASLIFLSSLSAADIVRIDPEPMVKNLDGSSERFTISGATVQLCTDRTCATPAASYTDDSGKTACPVASPVVLAGTSQCVSVTDVHGRFGFWLERPFFPEGQSCGPKMVGAKLVVQKPCTVTYYYRITLNGTQITDGLILLYAKGKHPGDKGITRQK